MFVMVPVKMGQKLDFCKRKSLAHYKTHKQRSAQFFKWKAQHVYFSHHSWVGQNLKYSWEEMIEGRVDSYQLLTNKQCSNFYSFYNFWLWI